VRRAPRRLQPAPNTGPRSLQKFPIKSHLPAPVRVTCLRKNCTVAWKSPENWKSPVVARPQKEKHAFTGVLASFFPLLNFAAIWTPSFSNTIFCKSGSPGAERDTGTSRKCFSQISWIYIPEHTVLDARREGLRGSGIPDARSNRNPEQKEFSGIEIECRSAVRFSRIYPAAQEHAVVVWFSDAPWAPQ
jgi:hypothetical protein